MVKYYKWDEEMTDKAKELLAQSTSPLVPEKTYERLERDARRNWDLFYKANKTNFYKDRHYIKYEFGELSARVESTQDVYTLLDAGCGVGNGFYPLYKEYAGRLVVQACDFSPRAVEFVRLNEGYKEGDIDAKTCDLVNEPSQPFPPSSADFCLLLFVLSAIAPEHHPSVASKLFA